MEPRIQVFLLNGPPYCGKDSLADFVINNDRTFGKMSLAFPIKESMKAFFGLTEEQYRLFDSDRAWKDRKQDIFLGKSWRQVCIDFAEEFVKPVHGPEIFGHLLVNRIKTIRSPKQGFNVIVSDCGFTDEVKPIIRTFGEKNVHVIKIQRPGSSYENDSRGYVGHEELNLPGYYIRNKKNVNEWYKNGFNLVQAIKHSQMPQTTPFSEKELNLDTKKTTKSKTSKAKK